MKLKFFIAILIIGIIVFAVFSANRKKYFESAEDFPREALVFVQTADLPQLIRFCKDSKYMSSENFHDFQNNHLGRKLASRFEEFGTASGFSFDSETISSLTENRASFALYDIGKLEFVLIAPMREEFFMATKFAQYQTNFAEETLADGTKIYRKQVEADRGRQKQELIFTHLKGRFILTTSEKLLAQTIENINGKSKKNRLSDEPLFSLLSQKIAPNLATFWINQTRLNNDYYFRRYWLMSAPKDLQNIRAGMFDLEIADEKLVERRKFLLENPVKTEPISAAQAKTLLTFLPNSIPFYRLQKADSKTIHETIEMTLFDVRKIASKPSSSHRSFYDLSENYEANIDETEEIEAFEKNDLKIDFAKILQKTIPSAVIHFAKPELASAPKFIEFKRGAVFNLTLPARFAQNEFETEIARKFAAQMLVSAPNISLNWETKTENNFTWRELKLPMSVWKVAYILHRNNLILANDSIFLREILSAENNENFTAPFNQLTVINLDEKHNAYTRIFEHLAEKKAANDFFTGNIESLLESMSDIKKIEIRRNYVQNILEEELVFFR